MFDKIKTILVVDDSAVQRHHAVSLLHELGMCALTEAANGQEALALLTQADALPSLLLLDLEMPGMDGVELLQQLQQQAIRIPVVILSSREQSLLSSITTMVKNTGMHVLSVVSKPLNEAKLRQALMSYDAVFSDPPPERIRQAALTAVQLQSLLNAHAVVAYFQPKVDVNTGHLKGVEALARIEDAALGFISPDRFIPIAEESGLIHPLTLQMVDLALSQCALWHQRGLVIKMAINLSASSLALPDFIDQLLALQAKHGVPSEYIVFEITESVVVSHIGNTLAVLARLRLKGFGLSIDDYGTGFSSMQQLAMIPFTELKVDRSLVDGVHDQPHMRVILQSAIDMAQRLSLISVAEGVETMEDWRMLQSFHCVIAQGFFIGKPMPAKDFPAWLKAHNRRLPALRAS